MINQYYEPLKENINNPYFVTLTIPNIKAKELKQSINTMLSNIKAIQSNLRRYNKRIRIKGIRKLECTYNASMNTYHPHIHFVVNSRSNGIALISQWLCKYPDANVKAQDIRKADDHSLIEMFKYFTKLVDRKNDIVRNANNIEVSIYPQALDVIFQAMKHKRVFQPIGIKALKIDDSIDAIESQVIEDIKEQTDVWQWEHDYSDWVNTYGEFLTNGNAYQKYKLNTKQINT